MFVSRLNLVDVAPSISMSQARLKHFEGITEVNKDFIEKCCAEYAKTTGILEATPPWDPAFDRIVADEARERRAATNAFICFTQQNEVGLSLIIDKYIRGEEVIEVLDAYGMGYTFFGAFVGRSAYKIAVDLKNRSTRTKEYDEMFKMLKSLNTPVSTSVAYSGLFPQFTQYSL